MPIHHRRWLGMTLLSLVMAAPLQAEIQRSLDLIRNVGKQGAGFDLAINAADQLRQIPITQLPTLLDALADANPIAENWIRGLVFDVVRRADTVSIKMLEQYAMNRDKNPIGRGLAMELIRDQQPETAERLIAECLHDESLPLREMAVQQKIDAAKQIEKSDPEQAKSDYRDALSAARHPQQLETIVAALRRLGDEDVDIGSAFAMIKQWHSLAPFDNTGGVGFESKYAPEQEFAATGSIDLSAQHNGKQGSIRWRELIATGDKGEVDLAAAYDKEKGAVSYLYTEFKSPIEQPAQIRLASKNANKVWVNGKLITANEVYHAGFMLDQYVAAVPLQQGTNKILLKICQNEQEESWAQDWQFQVRLTAPDGRALRSDD